MSSFLRKTQGTNHQAQSTTPRILIIAGSDSGGGAGIQADIKTVTCLGGYAATAITALTAQNTHGVTGVHPAPPEFVSEQIGAVLTDIGADALKTGMLFSSDIIRAVAASITPYALPLVLDPVMIAKGGAPLLEGQAKDALLETLVPLATLITPNIPEAEYLTGLAISSPSGMQKAGEALLRQGARAALVKGGHAPGNMIHDVLVTESGTHHFTHPRIESRHTHGTGCTLASAVAVKLSQKNPLKEAVEEAIAYVEGAIIHAPHIGGGHGPLNHGWMLHPVIL